MAGHNVPELTLADFIIRIVSPTLVFLVTLSLVFSRAPSPTSLSPITSVVVATRVPRHALILSLLSLASLTFLLDGLTFVVYAVLNKVWPPNTGIEINAIVGIIAFSGLAVLGTWKDVHRVPVWSMGRVKAAIAIALLLDTVHVVLVGLTIKCYKGCEYPI
jgi:ATP-binding cassette subfamily B (MDR/TAP) protein 6